MQLNIAGKFVVLLGITCLQAVVSGQQAEIRLSDQETSPAEAIPSPAAEANELGPDDLLLCPRIAVSEQSPAIQSAEPSETDQVLPINLASALYLSNARPLAVMAAQAAEEQAAARLQNARVLWLPNLNVGVDYFAHSGAWQTSNGTVIFPDKSSLSAGGGVTLSLGVTDAIFRPLAARRELSASQFDVQTARNGALLAVAVAYFEVQSARGRLAGMRDTVNKGEDLVKQVSGLAMDLVPQVEVARARAFVLELQQNEAVARAAWQVTSARLTRLLRLNPSALVVPVEPPHLQVTLISPDAVIDELIPVGLQNRPELASQQALVAATLERLRQERIRPLVPSVVLQGSGLGGALNGSVFGGGQNGLDTWGGRSDVDVGLVWTLNNLGLGNRSLVRERAAEQQRALIALFDTQDQIAQEVVQAQAQVQAAQVQVREAETGAREALDAFQGTIQGLRSVRIAGDLLQLVNRPQEAVAALQQLNRAYDNYYGAISGYNRAQFQLYHALGFPARTLAAERPVGEVQPVDTSRPPPLAPVCSHLTADPGR